ncbi:hypothetical protein FGO68_gene12453 [Halteria grandinella]|uniref:RRM domain-containing protein n=1 Tax=Halteria grandinella TaxID=5974 RepID=A0A8J8T6Q8_HALGN|nr:hypothetical protein FGO68_gene12453 [Halteria grandinella]
MSSPRNNHRYSAQGRRSRSNSPQRGSGNYRSRSRDNRKGSYSRSPRRGEVKDSFTQIYVARLDRATGEEDLQRAFAKFGKIKELALKHTFAFIDYEDHDSAIRAIRDMNRTRFVNGETLLVEQSGT